jgi:DNA-directed RNA polymerase subunit RPC12/RpoP
MVIKSKCSNCGKENEYSNKEWEGRELTLCNHCGHTLTVCGWFVVMMQKKK